MISLTFLGTGTSQGVPIMGCSCEVCRSTDPKDKRLRTSALVEWDTHKLVIDPGPDFRQQMLRENIMGLDALLLTHAHRDHIGGIDDIRAFNYYQQMAMPVYGTLRALEGLKENTPYAFAKNPYPGVPEFELYEIKDKAFCVDDLSILPIEVMHHKLPISAFRLEDLVYITDANFISPASLEKMKGCDTLVINALRMTQHLSHFTLAEALKIIDYLNPRQAYLTHISHALGLHKEVCKILPSHVSPAYDGLKIHIG